MTTETYNNVDELPDLSNVNGSKIASVDDLPDLKKKEEPTSAPSVSGTPVISPSKSPLPSLSEEERKKQLDYILKRGSGGGLPITGQPISISDHVLNKKISPKEQYELTKQKEAIDIAEALKNPSIDNVKKLAEKGIEKKVGDIATLAIVEKAKILEPDEKPVEVPEINEAELKKQLTNQFNKKFISGELNSDDIDILKSGNTLLNPGNLATVNNEQIASQINTKTSNLREYSRAKNIDGNTFYSESKNLENSINSLQALRINIESTSADQVFVDANSTKLPNEGSFPVNGQILVNRESYLAELDKKLEDERNKEFFLKNDFKTNRYDPVAAKQSKILIDTIIKSGNIDLGAFGTGISPGEDAFIKKTVDEYLRNLNDPVINAAQGVTEQPVGQREYLDMYNQVRDYFHNVIPVKGWVDNEMKHFMNAENNQKFKPLVDNIENIHSFFDSNETEKFESVLNATTDANQAAIFDKYSKILSKNEKFIEIATKIKTQIENKEITEQEANSRLEKEIKAIPDFKPILDKENSEIRATILAATKQREKRMINGIKGLPENIILNEDGTIGLKGVSPEETKKFIENYYNRQNQATKDAVQIVANDRKQEADEIMEGYRKQYGGFLTSLSTGVAQGYGNMMEAATRWLSNSFDVADGMRDYYTTANKALGETVDNSEFAKKHFKYNGLRSLIDPRYYAYNVGQSSSYMVPGMVASIATGGGATGAIAGGLIGSTIETAQNGLQTYNELLTTGQDEFGLPMTEYKAGRAMAQQMGAEIIPNLFLQSLEFGTIFRGAKLAKPKLNILGGVGDLAKTGGAEGLQEAIQGDIQYNAKQRALGLPELDLWDYMQSDDFRQNFFGGLAGGIGFGAAGKSTQLLNRSKNLKQWETLVSNANSDFQKSSFYGYATQAQMNGEGAQFRDALRLRLQNEQFKDAEEKTGLMQMLSYSAKLADATKSLGVAPGNINGLAAAHNLALSDMYEDYSNTGNKDSALSKIYKQKASDHKSQAQEIINGNDKSIYYALASNGTPIFISQQNAKVLQEEGTLDNLYSKGVITGVSDNIKVDTDEVTVRVQKLKTRKSEIESELSAITRVVTDESGKEIGRTIPKENQDNYIDLSKELNNVNISLEGLKTEPTVNDDFLETLRNKAGEFEKAEGLDYFMKKATEAPVQFYEKYGEEITNKLLENVSTVQLAKKKAFLEKEFSTENPNVAVLGKLISERESKEDSNNSETNDEGETDLEDATEFEKEKVEEEGATETAISKAPKVSGEVLGIIQGLSNSSEMRKKAPEKRKTLLENGYSEIDLTPLSYDERVGIMQDILDKGDEPIIYRKDGTEISTNRRNLALGAPDLPYTVLLKNKTAQTEKVIVKKGKELADKIRGLKSKRDIAAAHIFGIAIGIYDGAIETIATAIEKGSELAQAIQDGIKYIRDNGGRELDVKGFKEHIEGYVAGEKPKIKVQVGEQEKPKVKVVVAKEDAEDEGDIIDDYEMQTSGEVNQMLSGKTIENVFGENPEGEQDYEVQKLNDMLQDGRNMIQMAQGRWGNDVMIYGKPLFEYVQKVSNDKTLTNKKAVLIATFLGELKESMIREPERRGEIQPLYNLVEGYYQQYMNKVGKELAAGRLLRLYRDKYLADVFADRILDEAQVKEKRKLQEAEQKKKIDDETSKADKKITKEQKDAEDKSDKSKSKKSKSDQSKKKKLSQDDAKKKAEAKMDEIKNKSGDKKGLIDKINEAIKRLNCK
jgi:hypothetical protein